MRRGPVPEPRPLLARLEVLSNEAKRIAGKAEHAGDFRAALGGLRELCRHLELLSRLQREGSGVLSFATVKAMLDRAAAAVIRHVKDEDVLNRIEADWKGIHLQ